MTTPLIKLATERVNFPLLRARRDAAYERARPLVLVAEWI